MEGKARQDLQQMQPQMLWTLSEGLERSWDNQDVPNSEKSACWGDQFMVGINGPVPLSEPEVSLRQVERGTEVSGCC